MSIVVWITKNGLYIGIMITNNWTMPMTWACLEQISSQVKTF